MADQDPQQSEQLLSEYNDVWNERDYSRIPDVVSESFTGIVTDDEYHGYDGLEEWIEETTSAFPDFEVEPLEVVANEETVMAEVRFTMTHEGEYNDIPPTGETIEVQAMGRVSVEDGNVKEHRVYFDRQEVAEELGVVEDERDRR